MAREMKDSGVEWIGKIPKEWEVKRLKNILLERKENNNPIKTKNILSLTNDRGVIPYSEKGNTGNKSKEDLTGYKLAYPNDIVLNSMNVVIGSVGLSKYYGCVSPVYYMLYSKNNRIEYYNYIFQTKVFQTSLKGLGNGILDIRMRIPMEKLNNVILTIPPLEEQEKIANYLDKKVSDIDLIIEKTKITIGDYKKYKQSIITETVTKGLNSNVEMKDSGNIYIGKIPKKWQMKKIKYLFLIKKDIAGKIGFDILSITQKGIKIKDTTTNEGQMSMDYSKYQLLNVGEFAMNHMDLLTGWVDISKYDGVTSPDYRVFKLIDKKNNSKNYYLYFMQICYSNKIFYSLGQGVSSLGRWRLQSDKFMNFIIPVPPLEEQNQIAEYLDKKTSEIDTLIAKKEALITELEEYKKSLIYECVTGKKEII